MATLFSKINLGLFRKGRIIQGRYKILHFLGKGSYGMVYCALDQETNQKVVVKKLRKRKGRNRKELLKREATMLTVLNHPSIPKYISLFYEKKEYFLVMEYIAGDNFEDLILNKEKTYSEKESFQLLLKILNVIKKLHVHKIIHRDLRLPNILYKDNQVFIIDFGLALFFDQQESQSSKLFSDEKRLYREISVRSDFYALGHFVLFLLYSDYETTSKKEQSWDEELQIAQGSKTIIRRMLQEERSYDNVDELTNDVEQLINGLNKQRRG